MLRRSCRVASPPLLLASNSPRRHELLTNAGVEFDLVDPHVDETAIGAGLTDAVELVTQLAIAKAMAVEVAPDQPVLAADTVVVHEGTILGKPTNRNDARATLLAMSNSPIEVVSAVAIRTADADPTVETTTTTLAVKPLTPAQVHAYVDTGAADDKAGGLAVQDAASEFIDRIDGCYTNVVGLPMCSVGRLLDNPTIDCPH